MKNGIIALVTLLSVAGQAVLADELESGVIHNYRFIGGGYGYLHDIADSDFNAHGAVGLLSFEEQNLVLGASGGYFWGEEDDPIDFTTWNANVSLGYVVRLMGNHLNIIPNVGGGYSEVELEIRDPLLGTFTVTEESWSIFPGIGVSYAITHQFAINGSYAWGYNFDSEEDDHLFSAGAKFAILEKVGLSANANFSAEFGFSGAVAAVEFHF